MTSASESPARTLVSDRNVAGSDGDTMNNICGIVTSLRRTSESPSPGRTRPKDIPTSLIEREGSVHQLLNCCSCAPRPTLVLNERTDDRVPSLSHGRHHEGSAGGRTRRPVSSRVLQRLAFRGVRALPEAPCAVDRRPSPLRAAPRRRGHAHGPTTVLPGPSRELNLPGPRRGHLRLIASQPASAIASMATRTPGMLAPNRAMGGAGLGPGKNSAYASFISW